MTKSVRLKAAFLKNGEALIPLQSDLIKTRPEEVKLVLSGKLDKKTRRSKEIIEESLKYFEKKSEEKK